MKTIALDIRAQSRKQHSAVPVTPRGRALHTIDWFLNGKPVLSQHDNPHLTVHQVVAGH